MSSQVLDWIQKQSIQQYTSIHERVLAQYASEYWKGIMSSIVGVDPTEVLLCVVLADFGTFK